MEARAGTPNGLFRRAPSWALGLAPLALIVVVALVFALAGAPGLPGRQGPPVEELSVQRTVLRPGQIELALRNDGADAVEVAQVAVNDAYAPFTPAALRIGRLGAASLHITYPWVEGERYEISLLTSTGATIDHVIPVASETPRSDLGFFGLMGLLGLYVGVIPVSLGMLWLPFVRSVGGRTVRLLLAFTVGLLTFLLLDATLEGIRTAGEGSQALGGPLLVFLGAVLAYLALVAMDAHLSARRDRPGRSLEPGAYLALLVATGIGLHNLGEGLAIGSAYATGALALGTFLVVGFALHNTTEGLAIVAPLAGAEPGSVPAPGLRRLLLLGLIAGAPAIVGAWIGASAFDPSLAAFLLGVGVGAIAQVIVQILPAIRDAAGRALNPLSILGLAAGIVALYATSLLVSV
jgi:zinc transporter ZupT